MATATTYRRFATRVVVGLVVFVVCLEIAGRIAGWILRPQLEAADGRTTIMTIGDSFTYGLGVVEYGDRPTSYPKLLEALLEESAPGRYRVVNAGRSGSNSGQWLQWLPQLLREQKPAVVLALIGTNNARNYESSRYLEVVGAPDESWARMGKTLTVWSHRFVVVRLVTNLVRSLGGDFYGVGGGDEREPNLDHGAKLTEAEIAAHRRLIERDLEDLQALTRAAGVTLVLGTYPEAIRTWKLNDSIRGAAATFDIPLFDAEAEISSVKDEQGRYSVISTFDGFHCNSRGYAIMAMQAYTTLANAGASWSPPPARAGLTEWLESHRVSLLRTQLDSVSGTEVLSAECADEPKCALAWFEGATDLRTSIELLQELAPLSTYSAVASVHYKALAADRGTAQGMARVLMRDYPDQALAVTEHRLALEPGHGGWRARRDRMLKMLGRTDVLSLPASIAGADVRMRRVATVLPDENGVQYIIGGEMFRLALESESEATYDITLVGTGTGCGPAEDHWPKVELRIRDEVVLEGNVTDKPTTVRGRVTLPEGEVELVANFPNDRYEKDVCDRNMVVQSIGFARLESTDASTKLPETRE